MYEEKIKIILKNFQQNEAKFWKVKTNYFKKTKIFIENVKKIIKDAFIDDKYLTWENLENNIFINKEKKEDIKIIFLEKNITPSRKEVGESAIEQYLKFFEFFGIIYLDKNEKIFLNFKFMKNFVNWNEKSLTYFYRNLVSESIMKHWNSKNNKNKDLSYSTFLSLLHKKYMTNLKDFDFHKIHAEKNKKFILKITDKNFSKWVNEIQGKKEPNLLSLFEKKEFDNFVINFSKYIENNLDLEKKAEEALNLYEEIDNKNQEDEVKKDKETFFTKIKLFYKEAELRSEFRKKLLSEKNNLCEIPSCKISLKNLLVASHIKSVKNIKNSNISREEKIKQIKDIENGFLFCPLHDKIFDRYLITFNPKGGIILSSELQNNEPLLCNNLKNSKITLSESKQDYLKDHLSEFLKKENS